MLLAGITVVYSLGCSADQAKRDIDLKNAIQKAINRQWQQNNKNYDPTTTLSQTQYLNAAESVSIGSVICFRNYANDIDKGDVELFEDIMLSYRNIFDIPNWKSDVDLVINARYGSGASLARGRCDAARPDTAECKIKKSYDAIWANLYVGFYKCIEENSEPLGKMVPVK